MGDKMPQFPSMLICRCYKLHLGGRGSPHTHLCQFSGQVPFNDPYIQISCQMLKSSVQNPTPTIQKIFSDATISSQGGFVFGKCLFHVYDSQYTESTGQSPTRILFFRVDYSSFIFFSWDFSILGGFTMFKQL